MEPFTLAKHGVAPMEYPPNEESPQWGIDEYRVARATHTFADLGANAMVGGTGVPGWIKTVRLDPEILARVIAWINADKGEYCYIGVANVESVVIHVERTFSG